MLDVALPAVNTSTKWKAGSKLPSPDIHFSALQLCKVFFPSKIHCVKFNFDGLAKTKK